MSRSIGITDFLSRQFITHAFDGPWAATFGEPERNMKVIIWGDPGQGKTEFCIQLAKYMARFTKVYYNSFEQGVCKTLQDALKRNNMQEVAGRVIFGDQETFPEMMQRLSNKNSPGVCIIDSRDYINLTTEQFKKLIDRFPRKCFIVVCWESASKPRGEYAKQIAYMCDVKIHVRDFVAYPRSRFGGNQKFVIWERKSSVGQQLALIQ
ncbi:MAG: hypothetical protein EPGJADBJ_04458 [Saprospiraceae bacterium]|nr:hypothetical protein [Saprospiraceae bacterium]